MSLPRLELGDLHGSSSTDDPLGLQLPSASDGQGEFPRVALDDRVDLGVGGWGAGSHHRTVTATLPTPFPSSSNPVSEPASFPPSTPSSASSAGADIRRVHINAHHQNLHYEYSSNYISTAKYNFMTFLPKFLFEQFSRYANLFFLFISIIQQIDGVSPTGQWTTISPLSVVLGITALKELLEDWVSFESEGGATMEER